MDAVVALQLESIPDLAIVNNRASLFIFLSSLVRLPNICSVYVLTWQLFARPIADDIFIIQYLQAKYKVNMQFDVETLAVDLILSSFDLLSCAMTRKEPSSTLFVLKSFLINKVPIILTTLSASMFPPDSTEVCVGQAMAQVDKELFPSMAIGGKSILQDLREEFLFSCVLHSLLRAENVQGLLGEPPLSSPPDPMSRYTKEGLVDQCTNDSEKAVQLVDELEKLDGNGGAISLALAEVCLLASSCEIL
jgi:mediator of RNA polymerase II transcription subunit 5